MNNQKKSKGFLENTLKGSMGKKAGQTAGRIRAELEKFTLEEKIGIIGSLITIGSLFLNWYSDVDVFRTGDTFSGLSGPLMALGVTMLILSAGNALMIAAKAFKVRPFASWKLGKTQLWIGSASLYFLVVAHFIYFHPQFGLNILSKQSESGVIVCLLGIVMTCLGGFLAYRKDGAVVDILEESRAETYDQVAEVVRKTVVQKQVAAAMPMYVENEMPAYVEPVVANEVAVEATKPANAALDNFRKLMEKERKLGSKTAARPGLNSMNNQTVVKPSNDKIVENYRPVMENSTRQKTDYERSQVYDHLKKMMERDTMTPEQRKKLRTKEVAENVFSAKVATAKPRATTTAKPASRPASAPTVAASSGDLLRSAMLRKKN
jgi:hypothetical protein